MLSSLSGSLDSAPSLLQHPATHASASEALLERLPLEEPQNVRRILQLLCRYGVHSSERSEQLLQLLQLLPTPAAREMVSCLPQLLGDSAAEVAELLEALKSLVASDRSLTLSVCAW